MVHAHSHGARVACDQHPCTQRPSGARACRAGEPGLRGARVNSWRAFARGLSKLRPEGNALAQPAFPATGYGPRWRGQWLRPSRIAITVLTLTGCVTGERPVMTDADAGQAGIWTRDRAMVPGAGAGIGEDGRLTPIELQTEIFAFADRYIEAISEVTDRAAANADDTETMSRYHNVKLIYATAAITVATLPDPVHALRDFIIMVKLQESVWSMQSTQDSYGEAASAILRALQRLDSQLTALASGVMSAESISMLDSMAGQWIERHPNRSYVAFVRFSDLGNPERRKRFAEQNNARGLLAPVSEATRELSEIRGLSERVLFVANRMPLLVRWEAQSFVYAGLRLPETQSLIEDSRRLSLAAESLGNDFDTAIEDTGMMLARERSHAILQLSEQFRLERAALFQELETSAGALSPLATTLASTASDLNEAARIIGQFAEGDSSSDFEMSELNQVVRDMGSLARDSAQLVAALQQLAQDEESRAVLDRLDTVLREQQFRLFLYAVTLIFVAGLVVFGIALLLRRTAKA